MSQPHKAPVYDELSDAALTERVRAGAPTAYPATEELRRRHLPAVVCYARLCARDEESAGQLAAQAFALAWQEVHRGVDPRGAWRHRLLMLVHQAGAVWAAGSRRVRLNEEYAAFIDVIRARDNGMTAPPGLPGMPVHPRHRLAEGSALFGAFAALRQSTQGILWHTVVERTPEADAALWTGERRSEMADLGARALDAYRESYLRTYLDRSEDPACRGFGRILDAAARRDDARQNEDLERHLAGCADCAKALEFLIVLERDPRPLLGTALVAWAGPAYLAALAAPAPPPAPPAAPAPVSRRKPRPGPLTWLTRLVRPAAPAPVSRRRPRPGPLSRFTRFTRFAGPARLVRLRSRYPTPLITLVLASAAVAAVTGLVYAAGDDAPAGSQAGQAPPVLPSASVTVTATATATATATVTGPPTAGATGTTAPPSPSRTPSGAASYRIPAVPTKTPAPKPPGSGFAQVVNGDSGLCLDVRDEDFSNGSDVILAGCDPDSAAQRWRVEPQGVLRNGGDSDYCLDSRGDTDRGLGVWNCSSADGRHAENLFFLVDGLGRIRPQIDLGVAAAPDGDAPGSTLSFVPAGNAADQRWLAG
ncbi:RICIN domain-containing protein [Streptomyces sp. MI02-7b]|uniref:RICIN domain-containing protein n=1 Tax=Streptomyces sp. MI02-7b TaxID=462941 RepID=UPI0029AC5325|nr:RICIN domain-containing protein [Streptomyces sp. MI02-7b]MDX3076475.1 RICIN domain-containing protein [Streptomyces sp. MI02-7b]